MEPAINESSLDDAIDLWEKYREDWNLFASEFLQVNLDDEQKDALSAIQNNPKVAISSGTSRGKDYVIAVAAICFMYLTPDWDENGKMISNTKIAMTAPTGRQIKDIIRPEIARIFKNSHPIPGRLVGNDIRTDYEEWFLTGFKADSHNTEAWTGFHAANVFIGVTEATGLPQLVFDAIEGNLQGNSRLVIVFNPNVNFGYAASAFKSPQFKKIRLNSLNAPNVVQKKIVHPGQVDYRWIKDRLLDWCLQISREEMNSIDGDFEYEGKCYRPNDLFRSKVLGLFPKESEGQLIPSVWIEIANERWKEFQLSQAKKEFSKPLRLGCDVAGMGRDNSSFCFRFSNYVDRFILKSGGGLANHMEVAGNVRNILKENTTPYTGLYAQTFLDSIGEGAGVYSRLIELATTDKFLEGRVHSCKFGEGAKKHGGNDYHDITGQYAFLNMRAYCFWAVRDWLNPDNKQDAMLPPDDELLQELTETKWEFRSDGKIKIEDKEEIKKRIKRSPDKADSLALTFWPVTDVDPRGSTKIQKIGNYFRQ